jgi:hypothetical protein
VRGAAGGVIGGVAGGVLGGVPGAVCGGGIGALVGQAIPSEMLLPGSFASRLDQGICRFGQQLWEIFSEVFDTLRTWARSLSAPILDALKEFLEYVRTKAQEILLDRPKEWATGLAQEAVEQGREWAREHAFKFLRSNALVLSSSITTLGSLTAVSIALLMRLGCRSAVRDILIEAMENLSARDIDVQYDQLEEAKHVEVTAKQVYELLARKFAHLYFIGWQVLANDTTKSRRLSS